MSKLPTEFLMRLGTGIEEDRLECLLEDTTSETRKPIAYLRCTDNQLPGSYARGLRLTYTAKHYSTGKYANISILFLEFILH